MYYFLLPVILSKSKFFQSEIDSQKFLKQKHRADITLDTIDIVQNVLTIYSQNKSTQTENYFINNNKYNNNN